MSGLYVKSASYVSVVLVCPEEMRRNLTIEAFGKALPYFHPNFYLHRTPAAFIDFSLGLAFVDLATSCWLHNQSRDIRTMQITVLFENNEYICVDKPPLVLTVPARRGEGETRPVLGHLVEKQIGMRLWPVHRLDEPVSGVVLFAKSARAHSIANSWFEKNLIAKTYEAYSSSKKKTDLPHGANSDPKGHQTRQRDSLNSDQKTSGALDIPQLGGEVIWQSKLLRGKKRAYIDQTRGKLSLTHATLVAELGDYFYWHLAPKTGRSHQLRFELYRHQFPIIGDVLYGGEAWQREGIALRHLILDFSHCPEANSLGLPRLIEASPMELSLIHI